MIAQYEGIGRDDGRTMSRMMASSHGTAPECGGGFAGGAVSMGVLVLDRSGRVAYANQEGTRLLANSGVIFVDVAGHVRCRAREVDRRFRRLVEGARNGSAAAGGPATLTLPRDDGLPVVAQVVVEPVSLAGPVESRGTLVLLRDADREPICAVEPLQTVFGLTAAEAGVVARLAAGLDSVAIAEERGVSTVTVRNQVKAALAKVGVGRQAELVSMALRVARI